MSTRTGKILWFGVSTLILLVMVYLADISRFISALSSARKIYLIPALFFGLMTLTVYAFSWFRFLNKIGYSISYLGSLRLYLAGQFLNSITPVGQFGGEPFMAYIIKDNTTLEYEEAFSTVLSADIINSIPIITFALGGGIYLYTLGTVQQFLLQLLLVIVVVVLLGGSLSYILWFRAGTIEGGILWFFKKIVNLIGRGNSIYEEIESRFEGVQDAFETIGEDPRHLVVTSIVVHLEFIFRVGCMYLVLVSLGVYADLTPIYFVLAFSSIASLAPTPGSSGVYEATLAGFITLFMSVDLVTAVAAGIIFRIMTYWTSMIVGYTSFLTLRRGS